MKKITVDQVEVLDAKGQVIKESDHTLDRDSGNPRMMGNFRVIKGGPLALLLLPLAIPILLVGFFVLMIVALFFGRSIFKIVSGPLQRRSS